MYRFVILFVLFDSICFADDFFDSQTKAVAAIVNSDVIPKIISEKESQGTEGWFLRSIDFKIADDCDGCFTFDVVIRGRGKHGNQNIKFETIIVQTSIDKKSGKYLIKVELEEE